MTRRRKYERAVFIGEDAFECSSCAHIRRAVAENCRCGSFERKTLHLICFQGDTYLGELETLRQRCIESRPDSRVTAIANDRFVVNMPPLTVPPRGRKKLSKKKNRRA